MTRIPDRPPIDRDEIRRQRDLYNRRRTRKSPYVPVSDSASTSAPALVPSSQRGRRAAELPEGYGRLRVEARLGPYLVVRLLRDTFTWVDTRLSVPDGLGPGRFETAEAALDDVSGRVLDDVRRDYTEDECKNL